MATQGSRDRVICVAGSSLVMLPAHSLRKLHGQPLNRPIFPVAPQHRLWVHILPLHTLFFYRTRKLTFSLYPWAPLCGAASSVDVLLGTGTYCGPPSWLPKPRAQSVAQLHFVVLPTSSSSTTRLSRQRRDHVRHLVVVDSTFATTPIMRGLSVMRSR